MSINFTVINSSAKLAEKDFTPIAQIITYPNPSSSLFTIKLNEAGEEWLVVEILDSRGHLVQTLFEGNATQNGMSLKWDGSLYG